MLLLLACTGKAPPADDTATTPTSTTPICVEGTPSEEWDGACEGPLCVPERVEADASTTEPLACYTALGHTCAGQQDEGGYFYRLQEEGLDLELAFLPAFGQDPTLTGLVANLGLVYLYRLEVGEPVAEGLSGWVTATWEDASAIEDLAFDGARLTGVLPLAATEAQVDHADLEPDGLCTLPPPDDDIVIDCTCTYAGLDCAVRLTLDLVLASPAP